MKQTSIMKKRILKIIISAAIIAAIYAGIIYFRVDTSMMYGIWMAVGWVTHTVSPSQNEPNFLMLLLQVAALLAPAVIIGFIMTMFKQSHSFKVAFTGTMIAYFISKIVLAFSLNIWNSAFIVPFAAMFIGYAVAYLLVRCVSKSILVWMLIIALVLINLLALPSITRAISTPIIEEKRADELSLAVKDMKFTAYYPTYTPEGLKATEAKFEGYHNSTYQHQRVSYNVGKLEFMVSEKLKNQDPVFNKTDNCDISAIWFEMRTKAEISQARVDQSRDNLSICRVLGKTDDGHDVYVEANKSQFVFYYMEVDGTIIVVQHDTAPKSRYNDDFEQEVLKIFNSMKKLNPSKLAAGY